MNQEQQKEQQKKYADYVKEVTPTHSLPLNMAKAFLTGGLICDHNKFRKVTGAGSGDGRNLVFCYPGFHQRHSHRI